MEVNKLKKKRLPESSHWPKTKYSSKVVGQLQEVMTSGTDDVAHSLNIDWDAAAVLQEILRKSSRESKQF
jgi:hypothetical protein